MVQSFLWPASNYDGRLPAPPRNAVGRHVKKCTVLTLFLRHWFVLQLKGANFGGKKLFFSSHTRSKKISMGQFWPSKHTSQTSVFSEVRKAFHVQALPLTHLLFALRHISCFHSFSQSVSNYTTRTISIVQALGTAYVCCISVE